MSNGLINRQYVGARYVPKIMGEWNKALQYEALSVVTHMGNSFTSKVPVPANVEIDNENYWVNTGNYNAQIESYREETKLNTDNIEKINNKINDIIIYVSDFKTNNNDWVDAINEALNSATDGGTIMLPYHLIFTSSKSIKCDPFISKNGHPIIIDFNGCRFGYTGNDWSVILYSNGWRHDNLPNNGWVLDSFITLKNGIIVGNNNCYGAIRVENSIYYKINNMIINDFINGCGIQFYVTKYNNGWCWFEENVVSDCRVTNCKIGYQTMEDSTTIYRGSDSKYSESGISGNHNTWKNCVYNINNDGFNTIDNCIGFDINGNMTRSIFIGCGGWLSENQNTVMYRLNGWLDGVTIISPWVDSGIGYNKCLKLTDNVTNVSAHWATIIGASPNNFKLTNELLRNVFCYGYSCSSGNVNGREILNGGYGYEPVGNNALHSDANGDVHMHQFYTVTLSANTVHKDRINIIERIGAWFNGVRQIKTNIIAIENNDDYLSKLVDTQVSAGNITFLEDNKTLSTIDIIAISKHDITIGIDYDITLNCNLS